jgi:CRISPR-associated protein (TIGR02710 family)
MAMAEPGNRIALIISVGTTAEPLIKAVQDALSEGELSLFLIYGRPFPGQAPDPFDVTTQIKDFARGKGVDVRTFEINDPESLDTCLSIFREVLGMAIQMSPYKTIVNFTGGTKAMSAALVHAALTAVPRNLVLEYVGGSFRNEVGRVTAMEKKCYTTAVEECSKQVLALIKDFNYTQALLLCESLPHTAMTNFLTRSVRGLQLWDNFHYDQAFEEFKHLTEASFLLEDPDYGRLAETVFRLRQNANAVKRCIADLVKLENKQKKADDVAKELGDDLLYSVADSLENASRRFGEKRFADATLRSYRAVEVAVQASLIKLGISPWQPQWSILSPQMLQHYIEEINGRELPNELSLFNGFTLLGVVTEPFAEDTTRELKALASTRNHSHLEHGYTDIEESSALKCFTVAEGLCQEILLRSGFAVNLLPEYRARIAHKF